MARPCRAHSRSHGIGKLLLPLLLLCCLGICACAGTQVQVRGQHDFAIGGVIRR